MIKEEWENVICTTKELSKYYQDIILIGGVAVYMHLVHNNGLAIAEMSHDVDFYISLIELGSLRDLEEVVDNQRPKKKQIIKNNVEMDIYVEKQHSLPVEFNEIKTFAIEVDGVKLASLEHLLILKNKAYMDRKGSAKEDKDKRDVIKILYCMGDDINYEILSSYFSKEEIKVFLDEISANKKIYQEIFKGNEFNASKLSEEIQNKVKNIINTFQEIENEKKYGNDATVNNNKKNERNSDGKSTSTYAKRTN